jgi:trehalose 6-phosphate phosphatase
MSDSQGSSEAGRFALVVSSILGLVGDAPHDVGLFVDFDGTLAQIVDDPTLAVAVPGAVGALDRLAARFGLVAVVSGRPAAFLADRLGFSGRHRGVRAFGLYGRDEILADGSVVRDTSGAAYRTAFQATGVAARRAAPEARIEDKGDSIALHYREDPEIEGQLRRIAEEASAEYGLEIREGRMVLELVAPNAPDKGDVVRRLATELRSAVAIGDDIGDIAAFSALDALTEVGGIRALKIAVGGSEAPSDLLRRADLVLSSPVEVSTVLNAVADALEDSAATARC